MHKSLLARAEMIDPYGRVDQYHFRLGRRRRGVAKLGSLPPKRANTLPTNFNLAYNILKYQVGLTYAIGTSPVFVEAGWIGDSWTNKQNAPTNRTYNGPFAGLGLRFLYP